MKSKRPHKDQRYRDRCFPGAEHEVFSPKGGGYAPLPYISRELLRHLTVSSIEFVLGFGLATIVGGVAVCKLPGTSMRA